MLKDGTQLATAKDEREQQAALAENSLANVKRKLMDVSISEDVQRNENINLRKVIDAQNKKIEMLRNKLARFGVAKVPVSQIEKKVFYSNNEKVLEYCNLVHEVHDQIRKSFSVSILGNASSQNRKSLKTDMKGSLEYLLAELRQQLLSTEASYGPGRGKKVQKDATSSTMLRDVRCELGYKSTFGLLGDIITHSSTQTTRVHRTISASQTELKTSDIHHLQVQNQEFADLIAKLKIHNES